MPNRMRRSLKNFFKIVLFSVATLMLGACGGGSTSSGGAVAPVAPPLPFFTEGFYDGTTTLTGSGENIVPSNDETGGISLEVRGGVAGQQQVRIAFAEFSGTSAIGPDGEFSIPSGLFSISIRGVRNNAIVGRCRGELLFDGVFNDSTVSGNITTTTDFSCDAPDLGPLTLTGAFEASLSVSKRLSNTSPVILWATNY